MKTIITSTGKGEGSLFDLRFGRAAWFCLYDDENGEVRFIENKHANAAGGAGTKASETAIELGVSKVISGDFGPKAKDLLDEFNIQMVILQDDNNTVEKILKNLKS
ncbi:dinitrogenase iron-molybdenum cofactor biosynthesis protein [Marinifilum sp. N1E240]|uniref:NifB/NifX family molybdenum-iron cluster-binding protein n=1 Tax=Marinifilum sp. N1E240 TaxID=2608082 RepID=UPI00128E0297|nr:NifB/NifX family molybdenum-iron cluster-binding protein [Marinifilum sp. N1E240]MPQ46834.1 dinitrogenase iron-molybdenum cofactor biosynthesis protein [Marinifilum sp. N1E240]